ncbi:hypothetical protein VTK56DRAFT_10138 [Thermocarpiscus australiensis]
MGCCDATTKSDDGGLEFQSTNIQKPQPPECCADKPSACCDVSCLDRLALRACEGDKHTAEQEDASTTSLYRGSGEGKPCTYRPRRTRDAYAASLEALGCICRALLALGEESCCVPKELSSVDRQGRSKRKSRALQALPRTSLDFCCSATARPCGSTRLGPKRSHGTKATNRRDYCSDNSCAKVDPTSGRNSCCNDEGDPTGKGIPASFPLAVEETTDTPCKPSDSVVGISRVDPEGGLSGQEHGVLSVSGMT